MNQVKSLGLLRPKIVFEVFDLMLIKLVKDCIRFYQNFLSPLKPPTCRFIPTCSSYVSQAFENYGLFKGLGLSILRISKCHPFHPGGYDPVVKDD